MCGIAGIYDTAIDHEEMLRWLSHAAACLQRRGPEGTRFLHGKNMRFAHTMLAFNDSADDPQPLTSTCGRYVLTFNGEIYNYRTLAARFLANTNINNQATEARLLCELFSQIGLEMFSMLRGMFAIAIFDKFEQTVYLSRDYLGKKPLYYTSINSRICFSSDLNALMPALEDEAIDQNALLEYLIYNSVPTDKCLLKHAEKVPPACVLIISKTRKQQYYFWRPKFEVATHLPDIGAIQSQLKEAVAERLQTSGASLGMLLSGGLDSSLVAAIAKVDFDVALPCFSVGFADRSYDETRFATLVCRTMQLKHNKIILRNTELADAAISCLSLIDEPVADPSLVPLYVVTRAAANEVKGLLTGDGADDIFMGYPFFKLVPSLEWIGRRVPKVIIVAITNLLRALPASSTNLNILQLISQLVSGVGSPPEQMWARITGGFQPHQIKSLCHFPMPSNCQEHEDPATIDSTKRAQLGMLSYYLQSTILTKLDRGSMLNGVELRSPFLQQDLVESAINIPTRDLLKRGSTKAPLRTIAEAYLPREIIDRPKRGFRIPIASILRNEMRSMVNDTLLSDRFSGNLVRRKYVASLLSEHSAGRDRSKQIWSLFCLATWHAGLHRQLKAIPPPQTALSI